MEVNNFQLFKGREKEGRQFKQSKRRKKVEKSTFSPFSEKEGVSAVTSFSDFDFPSLFFPFFLSPLFSPGSLKD